MKSMHDLCAEALQIQDACNLYALANRFARVLEDLRANGVSMGDAMREHPVTVLWVNKIDSLVSSSYRFDKAYDFCSNSLPCVANVSSETGE